MKVSISIPTEDLEFLDEYARSLGGMTRSAVIVRAVRLLRARELGAAYAEAWEEWDSSEDRDLWESVVGDGLDRAERS